MKLLELEDGTICIKIGKQNQVQVIKRTSSSIDISRIENHFKVSLVLKEKFKMYSISNTGTQSLTGYKSIFTCNPN